jgi:TonB family protein
VSPPPAATSPALAQPRPSPAAPSPDQQVARLEPPAEPAPPARPESPRDDSRPALPPRDALAPSPPSSTSRGRTSPEPDPNAPTGGDTPRRLPGLDSLLRDPTQMARVQPPPAARGDGAEGGGGPRDFLRGIEEGEGTFLNTREFRYAYYYNQIKRGIGNQWNPAGALARAFGANGVNLPAESLTNLMIVLEGDGRVASVDVTIRSGVDVLDREAIRSVVDSRQFPAPPPALLDPDGRFRMPFGFHVLAGGGGRLTFYGPEDRDLLDRFPDPFGRGRRATPRR